MANTVTVACKHPNGLHLDLEATDGTKARVTVKGCAVPYGMPNTNVGGYALTEVDADHWAAWFEKNKASSLVKDRIIFASPKKTEAEARANNNEGVVELNPALDPDAAKADGVTAAESE